MLKLSVFQAQFSIDLCTKIGEKPNVVIWFFLRTISCAFWCSKMCDVFFFAFNLNFSFSRFSSVSRIRLRNFGMWKVGLVHAGFFCFLISLINFASKLFWRSFFCSQSFFQLFSADSVFLHYFEIFFSQFVLLVNVNKIFDQVLSICLLYFNGNFCITNLNDFASIDCESKIPVPKALPPEAIVNVF